MKSLSLLAGRAVGFVLLYNSLCKINQRPITGHRALIMCLLGIAFLPLFTNISIYSLMLRVKSGIFGQTAKFGQRFCLFHISNIGIKK